MTKQENGQSAGRSPPDAVNEVSSFREELETAVLRHQSVLIRYAERMLPDRRYQAQDIVQEAFLRMRSALADGKTIRASGAWLFRVVHNLTVDLNRRENRHCKLEETMLQQTAVPTVTGQGPPAPDTAFSRNDTHQFALRALEELPPNEKQILLLKLLQGMTLREISDMTGTKIGTVHYRLTCGLKKLSARFKAAGVI